MGVFNRICEFQGRNFQNNYQKFSIFSLHIIKDTALEKHRLTFKKMVKFFIANSIGLLNTLPSNRTCLTVFILIF